MFVCLHLEAFDKQASFPKDWSPNKACLSAQAGFHYKDPASGAQKSSSFPVYTTDISRSDIPHLSTSFPILLIT